MNRSKLLVALVLCIATTVFAVAVFNYTKRQEEEDFQTRVRTIYGRMCEIEHVSVKWNDQITHTYTRFGWYLLFPFYFFNYSFLFLHIYIYVCMYLSHTFIPTQFTDFANQIIEVYQINALNIVQTLESASLSMTSYVIGKGSEWPFVTIPRFEALGDHVMTHTGATAFSLVVLVNGTQRMEWEEYSVANQGWMQDSYDYFGLNETAPPIFPSIHGNLRVVPPKRVDGLAESRSQYAPIWQAAPPPQCYCQF